MINHETQLFSIDHKSPQIFKKDIMPKPIKQSQILISGHPLPSLPNTITRLLLAYHWAMFCQNWSEDAKHDFRGILPVTMLLLLRLLFLQLLVRYRPPFTNLTAHYKSQFCLGLNFGFYREAKKRLYTCLNGAGIFFLFPFKHVWCFLLI